MRSAIITASLASTALATYIPETYVSESIIPAAPIYDNPLGTEYKATFDGAKGVTGYISFLTGPSGSGVDITVSLSGFAGEPGPYGYHIHDQPVPADGNCTGTKAHLDPYGRGQETPCDPTQPQTCEVGDLAGKHGKIPDGSAGAIVYETKYNDLYASNKEGIGAFLGNRSVVIHRKDSTRLACVNILPVVPTTPEFPTKPRPGKPDVPLTTGTPVKNDTQIYVPSGTGAPIAPSGTGYPNPIKNNTIPAVPAEPSFPTYTGSAATYGISVAAALGGAVAVMLTL